MEKEGISGDRTKEIRISSVRKGTLDESLDEIIEHLSCIRKQNVLIRV